MTQYLLVIELKGNKTKRLKGHIILKRLTANDPEQAVKRATEGKIFKEEGFEIVTIENV